jgi:hypothetical protein
MQTTRTRFLAIAALAAGGLLLHQPGSSATVRTCAVPAQPSLCGSFGVFRRPARPEDRLPRLFRRAPPLRLVDLSSSRRAGGSGPKGQAFYLLGGKRYLCVVQYSLRQRAGGFGCSHARDALSGRMYIELACEPAPRRHRLLFAQPMPDGVRAATVHRVGRAAIRLGVRRNLLVADLRVSVHDDLPDEIVWRLRGRLHRRRLPVDDQIVTCRAPRKRQPIRLASS